jgi:hypothetical protein
MSRTRFKRTERIPLKHLGKRVAFLREVSGVGVRAANEEDSIVFVSRSKEWVHYSIRKLLFADSPEVRLLSGQARKAYDLIAEMYQFGRERSLVDDAIESAVMHGRVVFGGRHRVELDRLDENHKLVKAFAAAERHWRHATLSVINDWTPEHHGFELK